MNGKKAVKEFSDMLPLVFKLITSAMMPKFQEPQKMVDLFPRLGMIYAIIMQGRHPGLSLIQRMVSMLLMDNICDQKVKYNVNCIHKFGELYHRFKIVFYLVGHDNKLAES